MTNTNEAIKTNDVKDSKEVAKKAHEKAIRDKNNKEMKEAKSLLTKFQDAPEYSKLPENVQAALKRVCGKARIAGVAKDSFADQLKVMFPKVGVAVKELDIFLKTKMGRGEFRKRIRESLKKAEKANRLWVEFVEETESWVLLGIGEKMAKGFNGAPIDVVAKPAKVEAKPAKK